MRFLALAAIAFLATAPAFADPLQQVYASGAVINGATTTSDGRLFLPIQMANGGPPVVEIVDGKPKPYPDAAWNGWKPGEDGGRRFVGVNAICIGPDGALWVVDRGAHGIGKPLAPHGPKLVRIDVSTARVTRAYDLGAVTQPWSFVNDVRFNGPRAYLTDAGDPRADRARSRERARKAGARRPPLDCRAGQRPGAEKRISAARDAGLQARDSAKVARVADKSRGFASDRKSQ